MNMYTILLPPTQKHGYFTTVKTLTRIERHAMIDSQNAAAIDAILTVKLTSRNIREQNIVNLFLAQMNVYLVSTDDSEAV